MIIFKKRKMEIDGWKLGTFLNLISIIQITIARAYMNT